VIIFLIGSAYATGLNSRFLLDDFSNLVLLEDVNQRGYLYYILTNNSGPSGRPVSLLSFAFQHAYWPNNPQAFKLVNVIIHLLNGVLIYASCLLLSGFTGIEKARAKTFALMVAAIWLVHPIHVNTVLYVVQRMTLLASFFTLAGVYTYLRLWHPGNTEVTVKRMIGGGVVFSCFLVLAVFSKENGILLPVFVLCIEFTLFADVKRPNQWKIWSGLCLFLPVLAVIVYLAIGLDDVMEKYSIRSFTMSERLMTEARILVIYLKHILLPHPSAFSLFHDNFPVSHGLLSPLVTLYSIAFLMLALIMSIACRKSLPVISFTILWFLGAHLLESTYLNLELYFEHRNYLASIGILFLLIWCLLLIRRYFTSKLLPDLLIAIFYIITSWVTMSEINLWSRPVDQAIEWQRRSPESVRAISEVGHIYLSFKNYEKALSTFALIENIYPDDIYPYFKKISIKSCLMDQKIDEQQWKLLYQKAAQAKWYGGAPVVELDRMVSKIKSGKCKKINIYALIRFVLLLAKNPSYKTHFAQLYEISALLNGHIGEAEVALNNATRALEEKQSPQRYILKIKLLIETNRLKAAEEAIKDFNEKYSNKPTVKLAYRKFITYYEDKLEELQSQ